MAQRLPPPSSSAHTAAATSRFSSLCCPWRAAAHTIFPWKPAARRRAARLDRRPSVAAMAPPSLSARVQETPLSAGNLGPPMAVDHLCPLAVPPLLPQTSAPPARVKGGQLPAVADHGCPAAGDFLPSAPPSEHPNSAPPCSIFAVPAPSSAHSGEPLLAVRRGACRLFVKMRSKPRAAGSLFREAQWTARRRRSPWFAVFAQPLCRRRSPPVRPRRFMFDSASGYFPMINCVCAVWFLFCGGEEPCVLREEGQSFNARRMFGAMHKSESPSFLQTPFGFVYGPRDGDRARDMVPTTRCSWWTT
ncbi:uncharacterized protein [Zea mays]|uniref:uncharacterized protein n=1 Tax=Zea mays TaxID=4577 RepID=UPI00165208DF|nr:uncharacterized protein LOC103652016 [Zea mays]